MTGKDKVVKLESSFDIEIESIDDDRPRHILICIHGIRDDNAWCNQNTIANGNFLDTNVEIVCVRYSRISSLGFIIGLGRKNTGIDVLEQIKYISNKNPESQISILCHSNGTKILSEISEEIDFDIRWIFLSASICRVKDTKKFRVAKSATINDACIKDWWPFVAEAMRPDLFGCTGVTGFNCFPIIDRSFEYNHGDAVRRNHIEEWVLPVISNGKIATNGVIDIKYKKNFSNYIRYSFIFLTTMMVLWAFY